MVWLNLQISLTLLHVGNVLHHTFVGEHWFSCVICILAQCLHMWFGDCNKILPRATLLFVQWWKFTIFFWAFKGLLDCSHDHIHMKWMAKLNDSSEHLAFIMNGDKLWAMHNDTISKIRIVVIKALQQKVSMYAKWFHSILSVFTGCSEQGLLNYTHIL
jgi:hypothetical protein